MISSSVMFMLVSRSATRFTLLLIELRSDTILSIVENLLSHLRH